MSNLETHPVEEDVCGGEAAPPAPDPGTELLQPRQVPLGGPRAMPVLRALPGKDRRMVGAWCFADVFGPEDVSTGEGMQVPPHPHTGLQTVSWLIRGTVHHRDSLGSDQPVRPGRLNLMSAGNGISHSERTPADAPALLHGAQLWVALPGDARRGEPAFEHHADLPVLDLPGARVTVIVGEVAGHRSPATAHTPLVGAEVVIEPGARVHLPLDPAFEHGVLPLDAPVSLLGHHVRAGALLYLGRGRTGVEPSAPDTAEPAHLLLLGGEPFTEDLVMWWNFVGRDHDEIVAARDAWEAGRTGGDRARFGEVAGDGGAALPAPELPNARLRPRPRHRPS